MIYKSPFIWMGNKNRVFKKLLPHFPKAIRDRNFTGNYFEPFCGTCSVFMNLRSNFYLADSKASLSDSNYLLVAAILGLQKDYIETLKELRKHELKHSKDHFKSVLNHSDPETLIEIAGRYLYINRASLGGLFRLNSKDSMNMGFRSKYVSLDDTVYQKFSKLLEGVYVAPWNYNYLINENKLKRGDFVYLDPPYADFTDSKTTYGNGKFDQKGLFEFCEKLTKIGVYWCLSNSVSDEIFDLYNGYHFDSIPIIYKPTGTSSSNVLDELVITNYKPNQD